MAYSTRLIHLEQCPELPLKDSDETLSGSASGGFLACHCFNQHSIMKSLQSHRIPKFWGRVSQRKNGRFVSENTTHYLGMRPTNLFDPLCLFFDY
jgi:hypothetical protein